MTDKKRKKVYGDEIITFRIPPALLRTLNHWSLVLGISRSAVIVQTLRDKLMETHAREGKTNPRD